MVFIFLSAVMIAAAVCVIVVERMAKRREIRMMQIKMDEDEFYKMIR
jgi:hypothetical protein